MGGIYPNPSIVCRDTCCDYFIKHRQHCLSTAFGHHHRLLDIVLYRLLLGLCYSAPWEVPSSRSLRCTRIFRLAIAIQTSPFSRPGVVVALVLKPNSSLMAAMAVTWLSPGNTSLCTSFAILCHSALVSGGTLNDEPFRISWSLSRVRSFRIILYRQTSV